MQVTSLKSIIVSRENCFKCKDIQDALKREGVPSEILYFKQGGAAYLAARGYRPLYLPITFLFSGEELAFTADGLADFMEKWETYLDEESVP
jgi:hypothetical protein